jgi:L-ascorbate metabolism protein UlaG (beta-lactamase superfamily)
MAAAPRPVAGRVLYVGHATLLIELDGVRLLTDPVLRHRIWHLKRRVPLDMAELGGIDAALVSHVHFDHFDRPSLGLLDTDVTVVVPRGARRLVRRFTDVREVGVGDQVRVGEVTIKATAAVHSSARPMVRSTPSLGFLVSGSRSIYFAGDTDLFDGMSRLAGGLDVALLPIWGWGPRVGRGHMNPERAARATALLRPRVVIPIHWGTIASPRAPWLDDPERPAREFAAQVAASAPAVEVRILAPGERTEIAARPPGGSEAE